LKLRCTVLGLFVVTDWRTCFLLIPLFRASFSPLFFVGAGHVGELEDSPFFLEAFMGTTDPSPFRPYFAGLAKLTVGDDLFPRLLAATSFPLLFFFGVGCNVLPPIRQVLLGFFQSPSLCFLNAWGRAAFLPPPSPGPHLFFELFPAVFFF